MAAIGRILVWYFAASGTRSLCCRSRLAIIEKVMQSLNDAQFSREKLMSMYTPVKEIISHYKGYNKRFYGKSHTNHEDIPHIDQF